MAARVSQVIAKWAVEPLARNTYGKIISLSAKEVWTARQHEATFWKEGTQSAGKATVILWRHLAGGVPLLLGVLGRHHDTKVLFFWCGAAQASKTRTLGKLNKQGGIGKYLTI